MENRRGEGGLDVGGHELRHRTNDWDDNGIAELSVSLGIRDGNPEALPLRLIKAHEAGTFAWRQTAGRPVALLIDQHLRAILVVARRQRPRDIPRAKDRITEAIAGAGVLGLVVPQVGPEVMRQRIFCGRITLHDIAKDGLSAFRNLQLVKVELGVVAETDDEDALPPLWHPGVRADHTILHPI